MRCGSGSVWAALLALFVAFFLTFDLKFSFILEKLPALAGFRLTRDGFFQGTALTVFVCLVAIACSIVLGFLSALGRLSGSAVLFGVSTFYTSFFRGTPLLVQIFLIYLGLPQLGPVPAAIPSGIIALSLNYGAYLSEIFRAGIVSIPHGQREAAAALGLHRGIVMWKIVLPQAMRVIIPPTGTQFIAMLKEFPADLRDGRVGDHVPRPVLRARQLPLRRDAGDRRSHLLGAVDRLRARAVPAGTALRQGVSDRTPKKIRFAGFPLAKHRTGATKPFSSDDETAPTRSGSIPPPHRPADTGSQNSDAGRRSRAEGSQECPF